jgi:hypothetical protein
MYKELVTYPLSFFFSLVLWFQSVPLCRGRRATWCAHWNDQAKTKHWPRPHSHLDKLPLPADLFWDRAIGLELVVVSMTNRAPPLPNSWLDSVGTLPLRAFTIDLCTSSRLISAVLLTTSSGKKVTHFIGNQACAFPIVSDPLTGWPPILHVNTERTYLCVRILYRY